AEAFPFGLVAGWEGAVVDGGGAVGAVGDPLAGFVDVRLGHARVVAGEGGLVLAGVDVAVVVHPAGGRRGEDLDAEFLGQLFGEVGAAVGGLAAGVAAQ